MEPHVYEPGEPRDPIRHWSIGVRVDKEFKPKWPKPPTNRQGFTNVRNGVFEHIAQNLMSPMDSCVYLTLLRFTTSHYWHLHLKRQ